MGHYYGHKGLSLHRSFSIFPVGLNSFHVDLELSPSPVSTYFAFCPPHHESLGFSCLAARVWILRGYGEGRVGGPATAVWEESSPPPLTGSHLVA